MTGYGLTVFQGVKPDRFNVRVIGVLHKFVPLEDIILIESDDPRLKYAGGVAGMSGSPIFLEGRLAGAFAYGFQFAKDPIAGVTPIEYMIKEVRRPRRGPDGVSGTAKSDAPAALRRAQNDEVRRFLAEAAADARPWWRKLLPPAPPPLGATESAGQMMRAAVPLAAAGFAPRALEELDGALKPYGLVPMLGAGGGRDPAGGGPVGFHVGESLGVELVRGDMSMVGGGTVTWVDGKNVAGFGHPMFGAGEIYLPVVTEKVHGFLPSIARSFKLMSPLTEAGTLVQDREACIVADTGGRSPMIPVSVTITRGGRDERTFHAEIARFKFLTPLLAGAVVSSAAISGAGDVTQTVASVRSRVHVRGFAPLELEDHVYAPDGIGGRALASMSGLRALGEVLFNPFQPAAVDRIDVAIDVAFRPDYADIIGIHLNSDQVEAGSRINLYVTLRPFAGDEYSEIIPLEIPRALAGQTVRIEAAAGNLVRPDMAPPENLREFVDNLRKSYSARAIVVTLQTPDEGATIHGKLLPDLPSSEIDTLHPSASTRRGDPYRRFARTQKTLPRVLTGKQEITIRVKDEVTH